MTADRIDRAIEARAREQHGVFCRRQVLVLGASDKMIRHRLATGRWIGLARGVYALPSHPPTWRRQCMAAVLAERDALVSGRSAGVLHLLDGFRPGPIELTAARGANHVNPFARVRRRDGVAGTVVDGIPVVTVEQVICDLAPLLGPSALGTLIDHCLAQRKTSVDRLADRFESWSQGRTHGIKRLGAAIELRSASAYVPPTTALEARLYDALDDPRLPAYERQAPLPWEPDGPQRIDALFIPWPLIVEGDGRAWHTRVADFARDRRRDRDASLHGYTVARYSYEELNGGREAVVQELLRLGAVLLARGGRPPRALATSGRSAG